MTRREGAFTSGVLIQGWAFDHSSTSEIVEILLSGDRAVQVLQPIMQVSVSSRRILISDPGEGRLRREERFMRRTGLASPAGAHQQGSDLRQRVWGNPCFIHGIKGPRARWDQNAPEWIATADP